MSAMPIPGRVPLPPGEVVFFEEPTFTPEACTGGEGDRPPVFGTGAT